MPILFIVERIVNTSINQIKPQKNHWRCKNCIPLYKMTPFKCNIFVIMKLESHGYCAALFARSYVKIFNSQKWKMAIFKTEKLHIYQQWLNCFAKI